MFDNESRYVNLEDKTYVNEKGREITYKARRFLPSAANFSIMLKYSVNDGDRLDRITNQYVGNPILYWKLCDANNTMNPTDLTDETGTLIRIPAPGF